jgi:hypothetical protein
VLIAMLVGGLGVSIGLVGGSATQPPRYPAGLGTGYYPASSIVDDVPPAPPEPSTYRPDPAAPPGPVKDAAPIVPPIPLTPPTPIPLTPAPGGTSETVVPPPIAVPPPVVLPPPVPAGACPATLAGTVPHVAQAGNAIRAAVGFTGPIQGRSARTGSSDHPNGLALDFIVGPGGSDLGDRIAAYALAHQRDFGITYVIWRQRFNDGTGFVPMADRGSPTANHLDHIHLSFTAAAPPAAPTC